MDETLCPEDAAEVAEALLPAQNKSYELALKLKLPLYLVKSIHSTDSKPSSRLILVVDAFLSQVEPRPTWNVIADALRSPLVNLPQLANTLETAHRSSTHCVSTGNGTDDRVTVNQVESEEKDKLLAKIERLSREKEAIVCEFEDEISRKEHELIAVLDQREYERRKSLQTLEQFKGAILFLALSIIFAILIGKELEPGLNYKVILRQAATVNYLAHFEIHGYDRSTCTPCGTEQSISVILQSTNTIISNVTALSTSRYNVSFMPRHQGRLRVWVFVTGQEIIINPSFITVFPDPQYLSIYPSDVKPLVAAIRNPYDVAINSRGDMVVCERSGLSLRDWEGNLIHWYDTEMRTVISCSAVTIDRSDTVYAANRYWLKKYSREGINLEASHKLLLLDDHPSASATSHAIFVHEDSLFLYISHNDISYIPC